MTIFFHRIYSGIYSVFAAFHNCLDMRIKINIRYDEYVQISNYHSLRIDFAHK